MNLNRTPDPLNRSARNLENDNWDKIEGKIKKVEDKANDFIDEISDEALGKVVENAKLDWDKMVDNKSDLPNSAAKGTTIGVKNDGKVYRFDGNDWVEIYEINLNPIAEVDDRLSSQLADTRSQLTNDIEEAENELKVYLNNKISNLSGLEIKGGFGSLADLENEYPNGESGIFIIYEDNHWYYYDYDLSEWKQGNELETFPWSEFLAEEGEVW